MKNTITILITVIALCFAACGDLTGTGTPVKSFAGELQGTWVSNDSGSIYSGSLIIDSNKITIKGYAESQTPVFGGDDNKRPFKGFTKGVALKGYSEEGKIFIEDGGTLQDGIPYTYQEDKDNYSPKYKILRFTFGGRVEILECR